MTCECGVEAVVQWRRRTPDTKATEPVGGCADHALTPAAAAHVHDATCTGPGKTGTCACPLSATVEFPFPGEDRPGSPPRKRMPPGW